MRLTDTDSAASFWLEFERAGQVEGSLIQTFYRHWLAMLAIVGDHSGRRPVQVPAVFNGNDCVCAGNYSGQGKAAVLVALVAAELAVIGFGILWDEHDHGSGYGLSVAFNEAFHLHGTSYYGEKNGWG